MKKKILVIILCGVLLIGIVGCMGNNDKNNDNNSNPSEEINNDTQEVKKTETIYEDDEGINLFINKYNESNESKITSDMLSKKHIGGRDRNNVVNVANDKLEINIYNNYGSNGKYNMSVYVGYAKAKTEPTDYKEQFVKYIKIFDNTLTDEEINNHWNNLLSEYHSSYEINDIDLSVSTNEGTITYFKFTKNIEL